MPAKLNLPLEAFGSSLRETWELYLELFHCGQYGEERYVSYHILSDNRQADRQAKANGKLDFVGVGCSAGR
jgi:hypothetical protein